MRLDGEKGVLHRLLLDCQVRPFLNHTMISYRRFFDVLSSLWLFPFLRRFERFRRTSENYSRGRTRRLNTHLTLVGKWLVVLLECACGWVIGLQITHQPLQAFLVGIVVFPAGKVSDMACLTNVVCPIGVTLYHGGIQANRKQDGSTLSTFFCQSRFYLILDPSTFQRLLREDQQELIVQANGLINALSDLIADFHVFAVIPASDSFGLQVGIEAFDKLSVFARVANEAGVVLEGSASERMSVLDEGIRQTSTAQENFGNIAFRAFQGVSADCRRFAMGNGIQSFYRTQVYVTEGCPSNVSIAKVSISEVGSVEVSYEEGSSAEVGSAEVGSPEASIAEVGSAEVGSAEVGSAEVGVAEVGSVEVGVYIWMLFSPCIPVFYSLPEKIKLLLVCHMVVHLFCSALIIERCRPICKFTFFCLFLPGSCESFHCGLLFVRLETRRFNVHLTLVGKWLAVWLGLACWWLIGLQIAHQPHQAFLVRIVFFPVGKVSDMACLLDTGGPRQPHLHHCLIQCDGKEHPFVLLLFLLKGSHNLAFHPLAIDRVLREDNQELIMQADRLVNAMPKLLPDPQIFRGVPASHAFGLQVGIEEFDKFLVLARVANEAGVVLDGVLNQGAGIGNEGIRQACLSQEGLRNVSFQSQEGIRPNDRRAKMPHCFQSLHGSQVNTSKDRQSYLGFAEVGIGEVGKAEVGISEVGKAEVDTVEVSIGEVGFAEVGFSEVGSPEIGSAEVRFAEVGFAEVGSPGVGIPEVGFAEVGSAEVGSAEVGIGELGIFEIGSAEVGSAEVGSAKVGFAEVGFAEVGIPELGSAEVGNAEIGISELGSAEVGSAEVGFAEVGTAEVGNAEVGFAEVGSAEVGSAEVGSAEVGLYIWMLCSPCMPVCYSLSEKIKLLLVCHTLVHLLCGAFIIDRRRPICKITAFCSFPPGSYAGVHRGLLVVQSETRWLNAGFGGVSWSR